MKRITMLQELLAVVGNEDQERFVRDSELLQALHQFIGTGGGERRERQEEQQDLAHGGLPSSTLLGKNQLSGSLGKPK